MTVLLSKQPVTLSVGVLESFVSPAVPIAAATDVIEVRLRRPTTASPLAWPASATLKIEIVAVLDGVEYRCAGQASGGIRLNVNGSEVQQYVLRYWPLPGKSGSARVELTRLAGNAVTEIDVTSE